MPLLLRARDSSPLAVSLSILASPVPLTLRLLIRLLLSLSLYGAPNTRHGLSAAVAI